MPESILNDMGLSLHPRIALRMDSQQKQQIQIGFLTVRKHSSLGFVGGLLVLNGLARPVEFHCTLPLLPTRAQQLLYGATLDEFVAGEQIGRALLAKAKAKPQVVLTDTLAALSVRLLVESPIAAIDSSWSKNEATLTYPRPTREAWHRINIEGYKLLTMQEFAVDSKQIEAFLGSISIDLIEPFGRIEGALMEAHPATKAA
ncbi:MAG: hypothetical protein ACK5YR_14605 [Pirellula sp.]|jgi:hypothetical protein